MPSQNYGWQPGVIGHIISRADETSPQGLAFTTGKPSICNDLRQNTNFELPPFYADHSIVSTIDVLIKGEDKPYGVLEIDNNKQQDYDQHDINFLTSFANVLAEAVATAERTAVLQATIAEKDRALCQKKVLAEELQHRVRNNLQLVYGMLRAQGGAEKNETSQRGIKAIARRVSALAQVYDHLLGNELMRITDFGSYVKSMCISLEDGQSNEESAITLTCDVDTLLLDLDAVTALGIVVTELVTNSYDHAFPDGTGAAKVTLRRATEPGEMATITVSDTGKGFDAKAGTKRQGLGLVRRLIEQIHGTVSVEFVHGTVWTIRFPVAAVGQQETVAAA